MARVSRQKLKILYLFRILQEKSDELHPLSVQDMIEELARFNISAERKSIYDDLEALRTYGMDIIQTRGKTTAYYVGDRGFELPEVRLLMDCVQSSKFITAKKTDILLKKLCTLVSDGQAQSLSSMVCARNRVKSSNEGTYYTVDRLATAIGRNRKVTFRYFGYAPNKERQYHRDGASYCVSPFVLLCDENKYYLLAWSGEDNMIRHYRVDRMSALELIEEPREGQEAFDRLDISEYTRRVFGMFHGEEKMVRMRFSNSLTGVVMDRFGWDTPLLIEDEGHFSVTASIQVSPKFFSWIFGLGRGVEILEPQEVREEFTRHLHQVAKQYAE